MARPIKTLQDRVADRTFEARRPAHRLLLESDELVGDKDLRRLQLRYRRTKTAHKRLDLAREFERLVAGEVEADAREERTAEALAFELEQLGPAYSAKRAIAFYPRFLTLEDGRPFRLEPWEREATTEYFLRRPDGSRLYKQFVAGIPRGNGKTPWATGLGVLGLVETNSAQIFQAAGSKDQAKVGTAFAGGWIEDGELGAWLLAKAGRLERRDDRGFYAIQSADGRMAHGKKPSGAGPLLDEWWLMESNREREVYTAFVTSLHKHPESCLLATSTAGYDKASQLGVFYEESLAKGEVETRRNGFLRIARNLEAGTCLWWYGMPEGYELDLENDKAVLWALRQANPSRFVDVETLLRMLRAPGCDVYNWLRLHLNAWTTTRDSWLPIGCVAGIRAHEPIPEGAEIWVAVDAALKHDTTAVVWGAHVEDGIALQGRAWAARDGAPAHEYLKGGRIDNRKVMDWIDRELGQRYRIREIVGDPRFFDDYLYELGKRGYTVAEFIQASAAMRDAEQHFYGAATSGEISWYDPDGIFPLHLEATSARATRYGFKVENPDKSRPIDLATAAIMARERASLADRRAVSVYEHRDLVVVDGSPEKPKKRREETDEQRQARMFASAELEADGGDSAYDMPAPRHERDEEDDDAWDD